MLMALHLAVRWLGIAANGAVCLAALVVVLAGSAPTSTLLTLVPAALSLWALLPSSPKLVATILASLANALVLLVGLFAVVGLGDYGVSPLVVALAWVGAVLVPALSVTAVVTWGFVAAQSNKSFKPNPLRGSA